MILLPKYKAAFQHIPKTGGTSISYAIAPFTGKPQGNPDEEHGWHIKFHHGGMHDGIADLIPYTGADWTIFSSIRNPYARALSHYLALSPNPGEKPRDRPWNRMASRLPFHEWLETTFRERPMPFSFFCPMNENLRHSMPGRDITLLRFEVLREDFEALCAKHDFPFVLPQDKKNKTRFPKVKPEEFFAEDAAARGAVLKYYASDFATYGYSDDPARVREAPTKANP